jgi:hypothetical protein
MGFTAKNLTKLQPKTRIFSTDYNSPTGAKEKIKLREKKAHFFSA